MSVVFKITDAASLALHTMAYLAGNPKERVTANQIASILHASEAHLAKVLQQLVKAGLIESTRGPGGGFVLSETRRQATLREVYEAIEGPLETKPCLLGSHPRCLNRQCIMGDLLRSINKQIENYFSATRVSSLGATFRRKDEKRQKNYKH